VNYALVATLGPATSGPDAWQRLLDAGATSFRLNTSHLTLSELERWMDALLSFRSSGGAYRSLILDLQGSKWRLGSFTAEALAEGDELTLVCEPDSRKRGVLPVPHEDFFRASYAGGSIALNDARVHAEIVRVGDLSVTARVTRGGEISAGKGITLPAADYRSERLLPKDLQIHERTRNLEGIEYAVSYVRDAQEMARYRKLLGTGRPLIAKLERPQAMIEADAVATHADAVWVCRGDLGAELGLTEMAAAVSRFSRDMGRIRVPVYMAGQLLEHMTHSPQPTRSEVCHLYDLLVSGYLGFVLSDETAVGGYAAESCAAAAAFRR